MKRAMMIWGGGEDGDGAQKVWKLSVGDYS